MRTPPHFMSAVITPFDEDGNIISEAHAHNLRLQESRGVTGFVLGGSTGEGPYLEAGERAALITLAHDTLGIEPFIMCGVQAQSVRQAITQVDEIASAGADAALVMTPTSLARGNHTAMQRFFEAIAERSPLPLFLYSVPAVTGYDLPAESVVPLATHPNIVGLKDSGGRPIHTKEVVQTTPDDFMVYSGSSSTIAQGVAAGAIGAITASSNYLPELISTLVLTALSSVSESEPLQTQLTETTREIEAYGVVGTKAAAGAAGLWTGIPRQPLQPVPRTELARIDQIVKSARAAAQELVAL